MSYIHCHNGNYYKSSKNLTNLFGEQVIQPFEDNLPELAADVRNKKRFYWDDIARILEQGQSNFDQKSFDEPSNRYYYPKDKVSIYCVHYMPMHLFGSYHVFTNCLTSVSEDNKIVFIDFGCGPLTSGIAFWAFAGQSNITYLGIDSSQMMLDKAIEINEYGPYGRDPFFSKFRATKAISDYGYLLALLDKYIEKGDGTQIIFNFCYFLASETININNLSGVLVRVMEEYSQHNMCLVYQNPDHRSFYGSVRSRLYGKWEKLKTNLSVFKSQVTQSNVQTFSYPRLINGSLHNNANVYYEIL